MLLCFHLFCHLYILSPFCWYNYIMFNYLILCLDVICYWIWFWIANVFFVGIGMKSFNSSSSTATDKLPASSSVGFKLGSLRSPSLDLRNSKRSSSVPVKCYSLTDLLTATGNFASGRLLGEGSIGRVYKAKYADGRVCTSPLVKIPVLLFCSYLYHEYFVHFG